MIRGNRVVVPASNGGVINRTTDFRPECLIVFCVRDHRPSNIISPDTDQRSLFSERFTDCHSQASARHGIEWRQRIGRGVELWFIAVLRFDRPTGVLSSVQPNAARHWKRLKAVGRQIALKNGDCQPIPLRKSEMSVA